MITLSPSDSSPRCARGSEHVPALPVGNVLVLAGAMGPTGASILPAALAYLRRGFSVVPQLAGAKHPCVKWKPFQDRLPTEEEWRGWAERWPTAGLAAVLGPVSGLFAIDVDGPGAHAALDARL